MLTAKQVSEFIENGFLVVHGLIPQEQIKVLSSALDRVIDKVNSNPEPYETRYTRKAGESWDTWGVSDLFRPELYETSFGMFLENDAIISSVKSILGEELRFWGANALWNPVIQDYYLPWHRDGGDQKAHTPAGRPNHVQFNAALVRDHSFRAIPGSHRRALTEHEMQQVKTLSAADLPGEVVVQCEPGDVLFMNAWTLHRGECRKDSKRRTLHINIQPKNEEYGGHSTKPWMLDPNFVSTLPPNLMELIRNLTEWDKTAPPSAKSRTAIKHIHLLAQPVETFKDLKL